MKDWQKSFWRYFGLGLAIFVVCMLAALVTKSQSSGYRFIPNGIVLDGQQSMICFEAFYGAGVDSCIQRMGAPNALGMNVNGTPASEYGLLAAPPAVATSTATSGGTIAAGTYRAAATYVTVNGGETQISSDSGSTQATTGSTSTLTITAPISEAGAVGWVPYLSPAAGAANSEVSQPVVSSTGAALCTGAFQIFPAVAAGFQAAQNDRPARWVCPFGNNWTITTQPLTAVTAVFTSTTQIGSQPNTSTPLTYSFGYPVPGQNTAGFPEAIPSMACNFIATTALTSVTTAQTAASCPLYPGLQNVIGKEIEVSGEFIYTSSAGSGAPVVAVTEGGQTIVTITGTTQTGTTANSQLAFDYVIDTGVIGASGQVEGHGWLESGPGASLTAAVNVTRDSNTALATAFSLTGTNTIAIVLSDATSLTSAQLRHGKVIVLN